jgi:predicted RNase H-like HicB family nuclease
MKTSMYSFQVVWSDDDEGFVASCPEFNGVSGIGKTAQEALVEAQTALGMMIETFEEERWALPEPVSLSSHSGQFRLRVPRALHARLASAAANDGVSLNTYAVALLSAGLGEASAVRECRQMLDEHFSQLRAELQSEMDSTT